MIIFVLMFILGIFILRTVLILKNEIYLLKNGYEKMNTAYKSIHPEAEISEENAFDILSEETEILRHSVPCTLESGVSDIFGTESGYVPDSASDTRKSHWVRIFSNSIDKGVFRFFMSEFLKAVLVCAVPAAVIWLTIFFAPLL